MGANNVGHLLGDLRPAGLHGQPHAIQTTEGSSPCALGPEHRDSWSVKQTFRETLTPGTFPGEGDEGSGN